MVSLSQYVRIDANGRPNASPERTFSQVCTRVVYRRSPDSIAIRAVFVRNFFMLKMFLKYIYSGIYFPSSLHAGEFVIAENRPNNARHHRLSVPLETNNSQSVLKLKTLSLYIVAHKGHRRSLHGPCCWLMRGQIRCTEEGRHYLMHATR